MIQSNKKIYGETYCPYCERPLSTDENHDKYKSGEGEHLCWNYLTSHCYYNCLNSVEETVKRLIEVLHRRDELKRMLEEALTVAEEKV